MMVGISNALMDRIMALDPVRTIAPADQMFGGHEQHYFGVGRSALMAIVTALTRRMAYRGGDGTPQRILDFGAGHGRVARYLREAFPDARVDVTDHLQNGVAWCIENLGCHAMEEQMPRDCYDLIWVGSVITHLPSAATIALLDKLRLALRPNGVLVITTGGRLGEAYLDGFVNDRNEGPNQSYGLSRDGAAACLEGYRTTGHGYHDYLQQTGYGGALIKPEWMYRQMLDNNTVQLMFQEMGWDTHQDVYAFMETEAAGIAATQRGCYF
jgi:SAM-dependent methyltransferase